MFYLYLNLILSALIFFITFVLIFLKWKRLCDSCHNKPNFFNLFFIFIYPIEELMFIFLYNIDVGLKGVWVGVILVLILLTLTIDKFLLKKQNEWAINTSVESQNKSEKKLNEVISILHQKLKEREKEKDKLLDYIAKLKKRLKKNSS